jgi:hypothetical protein
VKRIGLCNSAGEDNSHRQSQPQQRNGAFSPTHHARWLNRWARFDRSTHIPSAWGSMSDQAWPKLNHDQGDGDESQLSKQVQFISKKPERLNLIITNAIDPNIAHFDWSMGQGDA